MILELNRAHIKVSAFGKIATLPGEMFFPENGKLGFVLFVNQSKHWDAPNDMIAITESEMNLIITEVRDDFLRGGHILNCE